MQPRVIVGHLPAELAPTLSSNGLVTFDSAGPGSVSTPVFITGLVDGSESFVVIDLRPVDGALVGVTRQKTVTLSAE